jgi:hypothetical protein
MSTYRCCHCGTVLINDDETIRHERRCALAHTCAHCGALPGHRCREPSGRPTIHRAREWLAVTFGPVR